MLHVRDCPGTTASFDVCPFPWCRKVKHLLYHLVSCSDPNSCAICSNVNLNRNMRRLHGLNNHRGEIYHQLLLTKARAKADAEKVTSSETEQAASKVDGTTANSDADAMEVMLLHETKSDTLAPIQEDSKINSKVEASDLVMESNSSTNETGILPCNSVSSNDIDYSINPPVGVSIAANSKNEHDVSLLYTTAPSDMDVTDVACIGSTKAAEHITRSIVDTVADADIVTDEAMVLPAIGSEHTLVHRDNTTTAADMGGIENASLSNQQATAHYQSITPDCHVKIESEFGDTTIKGNAMTPVIESDTTSTDGKESNVVVIVLAPTTVVGDDSKIGVKVELS